MDVNYLSAEQFFVCVFGKGFGVVFLAVGEKPHTSLFRLFISPFTLVSLQDAFVSSKKCKQKNELTLGHCKYIQ